MEAYLRAAAAVDKERHQPEEQGEGGKRRSRRRQFWRALPLRRGMYMVGGARRVDDAMRLCGAFVVWIDRWWGAGPMDPTRPKRRPPSFPPSPTPHTYIPQPPTPNPKTNTKINNTTTGEPQGLPPALPGPQRPPRPRLPQALRRPRRGRQGRGRRLPAPARL